MKRILCLFISIILYFGLITASVACEFLKEQIGSPIVNMTEKYDFLDDPSDEDSENLTLVKEYDSMSLCDDVELDNSIIKVFVKEGKIIGNEIEGKKGEAAMRKILEFAKDKLGYTTEKVLNENWVGGISLSSAVEKVTYGVVESNEGNYEMLIITNPDLQQFMSGPNIKMVR